MGEDIFKIIIIVICIGAAFFGFIERGEKSHCHKREETLIKMCVKP